MNIVKITKLQKKSCQMVLSYSSQKLQFRIIFLLSLWHWEENICKQIKISYRIGCQYSLINYFAINLGQNTGSIYRQKTSTVISEANHNQRPQLHSLPSEDVPEAIINVKSEMPDSCTLDNMAMVNFFAFFQKLKVSFLLCS